MKLKKLTKAITNGSTALFNCSLVFSIGLHVTFLFQIPEPKINTATDLKAKETFINIKMENVTLKEKINMVKPKLPEKKINKPETKAEVKKETEPKRIKLDKDPLIIEKELLKKEVTPKKEESKKEKKAEIKIPQRVISPSAALKKENIKNRENYKIKLLEKIHKMKYYPRYAIRMNQQGIVKVQFTITKDGCLKDDILVIEQCTHQKLNEAAIQTIKTANPFPPFPENIDQEEMTLVVDLDFSLK